PGVFGSSEDRQEGRTRDPQQRNAGGAKHKRGPDLGGRSRPLVGGDPQPQYQQRGRHRGRADDCRKGFKDEHRSGKYIIFPCYPPFKCEEARTQASVLQQPRQIFFNCAFIRASSALIVSTYFPGSAFPGSAVAAGFADTGAADFATLGLLADGALSWQTSLPSTSGIALQSGVWAMAGGDN